MKKSELEQNLPSSQSSPVIASEDIEPNQSEISITQNDSAIALKNEEDAVSVIEVNMLLQLKQFYNNRLLINGWSADLEQQLEPLMLKLKYNRAVNNFCFFNLKSKENFWSWTIVVISTVTSLITLLNTVESELFPHYFLVIKILLTLSSICTSLIAAWIKKQMYVERINNTDRYLQKLNHLVENIEVQLTLRPHDRMKYQEFKKQNIQLIPEFLSSTPYISPVEWKDVVYNITKNYPEIINPDDNDLNKLWPWYGYDTLYDKNYNLKRITRPITNFGNSVVTTYMNLHKSKYFCSNKHQFTKPDQLAKNCEAFNHFEIYDRVELTSSGKELIKKIMGDKYPKDISCHHPITGCIIAKQEHDGEFYLKILYDIDELNHIGMAYVKHNCVKKSTSGEEEDKQSDFESYVP